MSSFLILIPLSVQYNQKTFFPLDWEPADIPAPVF